MFELLKDDAKQVMFSLDLMLLHEKIQYKQILITGASGLIGVHLLTLLHMLPVEFNCVAVIRSDLPEFLKDILKDERFEFYQADLTTINQDEYEEQLEGKFDIIFHLATYGQPSKFMDKQLETIKLNTSVTMGLFDVLEKGGKFIYLSSSELYSGLEHVKTNFNENDIGTTAPDHDRACYIESKRCGEAICNVYSNMGYDVKIIRLSLAYGTGVKLTDSRAINTFIWEGLTSDDITILDAGRAIRRYIYISDAIEMIMNIVLMGKQTTYNVANNNQAISILELAKKIGDKLNVPVSITGDVFDTISFSSPKDVCLDILKYENEFSSKRFIELIDGLHKTINWYKELLEIKVN